MNIADRIEKFFDEALLSEDGLLFSSLKKDSMSSWKLEDFNAADLLPIIPGYEKMDFSDFMNCENTGMVQGAFLSAMCLKYKVTGEAKALDKARRTFNGICKVYEMSQKIADGFYCKPWGGHVTNETSSDQYIYSMSGLDDYFELASPVEKKRINVMLVAMARFWLDHLYSWKYYGQPLEWRQTRFISFMALAVRHGGGNEFRREWERLDTFQKNNQETPFRSTVPENEFDHESGRILSMTPETCLSSFLSLESAMKLDNKPFYLDICRRSFEYGRLGIADDGTSFAFMDCDPKTGFRKELDRCIQYKQTQVLSPIFGLLAPYRKGGMQTIMFARFAVSYEYYASGCGGRALAEEILRRTGTGHLTWFEDPFHVMPPEIQWMTHVFSGDAAAHWLWCYWKMRLQDKMKSRAIP